MRAAAAWLYLRLCCRRQGPLKRQSPSISTGQPAAVCVNGAIGCGTRGPINMAGCGAACAGLISRQRAAAWAATAAARPERAPAPPAVSTSLLTTNGAPEPCCLSLQGPDCAPAGGEQVVGRCRPLRSAKRAPRSSPKLLQLCAGRCGKPHSLCDCSWAPLAAQKVATPSGSRQPSLKHAVGARLLGTAGPRRPATSGSPRPAGGRHQQVRASGW